MDTNSKTEVSQSWAVGRADVAMAFLVSGNLERAQRVAKETLDTLNQGTVATLTIHPEYFRAHSQLVGIAAYC